MFCKGIAVCAGRVLAQGYKLTALPQFDLTQRTTQPVEHSLAAIKQATQQFKEEFTAAAEKKQDAAYSELIEVQFAMMEDDCFTEAYESAVQAGFAPAAAVLQAASLQEEMLKSLCDPYLSARAEDVHDLGVRIACRLLNIAYPSLEDLPESCIVLAADLLPSMLMTAPLERIKGIVIETGTKTSHVSILASGMEIPTIVSCKGAMAAAHGELVYIDGETGEMGYALTAQEKDEAEQKEKEYKKEREELLKFADRKPTTADGRPIEVHVNIVDPMVLEKTLGYNIDGVGLFRTEFLYMNRQSLPTENEQYGIYSYAVNKLGSLPLTIRTMDIGGDKQVECLDLPKEENPFMGYRAVRICLKRPDVFLPQLKAILRANTKGSIGVMFPMIAQENELKAARKAFEEAKAELKKEGVSFCGQIRIGIMVEVPSAVLMLDRLAKLVDFVSIGSNDLTQYTYAADRMNPDVAYLYDFLDPAVLRLIAHTIKVSQSRGIQCSLCGEMAGDGRGLAALVALGLEKVSVTPSGVLKTKKRVSMLNAALLQSVAGEMLNAESAQEVSNILLRVLPEEYPV